MLKNNTNVEGPINCKAATSTTRQCNTNDNDNNITEWLAWSDRLEKKLERLVIKIRRRGKILFFMCVCLEPKTFY